MRRKRYEVIIILAITLVSVLVIMNDNISNCVAKTYSANLDFGEYLYVFSSKTMDSDGHIDWSYTGSNSYVGITVWILDDENFAIFQSIGAAYGYEQSDGSYYSDSGSFDIPNEDIWYIVFMHNDITVIFQSTSLSANVNFVQPGLETWLLAILIVIPIFIVTIIILAVVLIIRNNKQKQDLTMVYTTQTPLYQTQPQYQQPLPPPPPPLPISSSTIFCVKCGSVNDESSSFCSTCGTKLMRPE